jgi:ABC-type taurine transport system substrate-binding protein
MAGQPESRDPVVERADVVKILQRAGLDEQDIATALRGVQFPERASQIATQLMHLGITRERLIDRMGGSP